MENVMDSQQPARSLDEELYTHGAGSTSAESGNELGGTGSSWQRQLNQERSADARTKQLRATAATVGKELAKRQAQRVAVAWLWSAASAVGSFILTAVVTVVAAILPYILPILIVFLLIAMIPGASTVVKFIENVRASL